VGYQKNISLFLFFILVQFSAISQEADMFKKYDLDKFQLTPGFSISVFAEVPNARSMCWGEKGTLFVGNRSKDKVYAVTDENKDGKADKVFIIDQGLNMPNGVAFRKGSLYVAEVNRILRYDDIENRLSNPPEPVVVNDKLPADNHHGWKFIAFGPDDKLYVPVGAPCNICEKGNDIYASVSRMNPDGSVREVYASGVPIKVGFAWHTVKKEVGFTENGRDMMDDDMPADELNCAPKKGMHFGYPYCHQGDTPDPEFGDKRNCSEFTAPVKKLMPHAAALGMRFYTGNMFSPGYKNRIFIAEHGSWNRSEKSGYRVMMIRLENNKVVQYVPFATGWLNKSGKTTGRPVDIEIAADGAMLVSDDARGAIYRITFSK